jgi:hypothetical protein
MKWKSTEHELTHLVSDLGIQKKRYNLNWINKFEFKEYHSKWWSKTNKKYKTIYSVSDVEYHINKFGFRTFNFEKFSEINLLTLGCSHTFGAGTPESDIWPNLLAEKLNIKKNTVCNLGICGASIEKVLIISTYLLHMEIKPKIVAVLLPHAERTINWGDNKYQSIFPWDVSEEDRKAYNLNNEQLKGYINWVSENFSYQTAKINMAIDIISSICKMIDSKCIIIPFTFKLRIESEHASYLKPQSGEHFINKARDLSHYDKIVHTRWAKLFYTEYLNPTKIDNYLDNNRNANVLNLKPLYEND